MKFIFASDSFKGTLTCEDTIELLTRAAGEVFEDANCVGIPVADGGEGTVNAVLLAKGGQRIDVNVHGPLMDEVNAYYGRTSDGHVVMEMASASGLTLIEKSRRNPLYTTSYGTGEMLRDALDRGYKDIAIAIGGSATNDGGMGCLEALGVKFLDGQGNELAGRGENLERVKRIDMNGVHPELLKANITVMCDVTNPLCGDNGATIVYGPQKGATNDIVKRLEAGMMNYRDVIIKETGMNPDEIAGSGAAGGLGAALCLFCNGRMKSGIDTVLDLVDFDKKINGADYIITGEGCADEQSCNGKVMQGVGLRAKKQGIPAIGLCGMIKEGAQKLHDYGITTLLQTSDESTSFEDVIRNAKEYYYQGAFRMFKMIKENRKAIY